MNEAPSPSTSERSPTSRRLVPSRSVAHWDLDITALMEFAGPASDAADRDSNWAEALLEGARIIHVNEQAVHMLGSFGGREAMIGQAVATCWPVDSRYDLAELILELINAPSPGLMLERPIRSEEPRGGKVSVSTCRTKGS